MKKCEICGEMLQDNTKFCSNCGADVTAIQHFEEPQPDAPYSYLQSEVDSTAFESQTNDSSGIPETQSNPIDSQPPSQQPQVPPNSYDYVAGDENSHDENPYVQNCIPPNNTFGQQMPPTYENSYNNPYSSGYSSVPYSQQPDQAPTSGKSIASMVLGIVSIPTCCFCGVGIIVGIIGLILGIVVLREQPTMPYPTGDTNKISKNSRSFAIAGIICSIIGIICSALFILLCLIDETDTTSSASRFYYMIG